MATFKRHELSNEQWSIIADFFPAERGKGRPYRNHRQMVNGLLWILHTGSPWRDLPERYGPWQTCYNRFNRWTQEGLIEKILSHLHMKLDENGQIDIELFCIDGSNIRAHSSAAGGGKKGGLKSRKTMPWADLEEALEQNCTLLQMVVAYR